MGNDALPMKFTQEQKLIIKLLCEIHQKLDINEGMDSDVISYAIETNNTWAITAHHHCENGELVCEQKVAFVFDILDMYEKLNQSCRLLSDEDRSHIPNFSKAKSNTRYPIPFPGFDGYHEEVYRNITLMLFKMDRYADMDGLTSSSNQRTAPGYLQMLDIYNQINDHYSNSPLSLEDITKILNSF